MASMMEKDSIELERSGKKVPVTVVNVDVLNLLQTPILDKYSMSCIVCYGTVEVAEYKDYDHSMCVIEVDHDSDNEGNSYMTLPCCSRLICKGCIEGIISTEIGEGRVKIKCPHPECGEEFDRAYVYSALSDDGQAKTKLQYRRLLADTDKNGKIKTCPKCSHLTEHVLPRRFNLREADLKITCEVCQQDWCFKCHAPWHKDLTCKEFKQGSSRFKDWTKSNVRGIPNCQKCPTCRIYIQRSTGCPHMQCDRCGTEFCYECGGRFLDLCCMDHYSALNVWGCTKSYCQDEPCKRFCVRWGYLFAKISYAIAYPVLFIFAVILVAILLVVGFPIYCCCKCCSYICYKMETNQVKKGRRSNYDRFY